MNLTDNRIVLKGAGLSISKLTAAAVQLEIVFTSSGTPLKTSLGFEWSAEQGPQIHRKGAVPVGFRLTRMVAVVQAPLPAAAAAATAAVGKAEEVAVSTLMIKSAQTTVTTSATFWMTSTIFSSMSMATTGV